MSRSASRPRLVLACLLILAIPTLGRAAVPDDGLLRVGRPLPGEDPAMRGMWEARWMWDRNDDRVDDRLQGTGLPTDRLDLVVAFDHFPSDGDVALLAALGFAPGHRPRIIDAVTGSADRALLPAIAALPGVARVEMQLVYHATNDVATKGIKVRASGTYADTVWDDLGYRGAGVAIAVFDTGVDDHQHETFKGTRFACGYDAINSVEKNPDDDNGHGTHVAGTALGNGGTEAHPYGTNAGAAPEARLVDVKVLNSQGTSVGDSVLRGIDWANDNRARCGIKVFSLSLGTQFADDGTSSDAKAINRASANGLVSCIAGGNHSDTLLHLDDFGIGSPGSADTAITVAALDDENTEKRTDDAWAPFSNRGPRDSDGDSDTKDEQKPEIAASGTAIKSAKHNTATSYTEFSGTSMATPLCAGVVALMFQANSGLRWKDVEDIINKTSEDKGTVGWDKSTGWGEIDAFKAVKEARDRGTPNRAPTASFTYTTDGLKADVDGRGSSDPDGDPLSYDWDWGDGTAHGTGATASHTYASAGTYTVKLTVNDGRGGTSSTSKSVTVEKLPNRAPTAAFTHTTDALKVNVDGTGSSDPDGDTLTYDWDWGDGTTRGSGTTASHTYAAAGTYTVTLTVDDGQGGTDTEAKSVTVTALGRERFHDDMESGSGKWVVTDKGGTGTWAITTYKAKSPTRSFGIGGAEKYAPNGEDYLETKSAVNLRSASHASLVIQHWAKGERYCLVFCEILDYGRVEVSTDNGASWGILKDLLWTTSGAWAELNMTLDAHVGKDALFRFRWVSDDSIEDVGWFIDDVKVRAW